MRILEESSKKLKHEFKIAIPSKDIEDRLEQSLIEYGKTAKIAGFRAGKVPLSILKNHFEGAARKDALDKVVNETINNVLKTKSLQQANRPQLDFDNYIPGQDLTFSMKIEVLPKFELQDNSKIAVQTFKVNISEKDIEDDLSAFLDQIKSSKPIEETRSAKQGDIAVVDAIAFHGAKELPERRLDHVRIDIGSGRFVEFEKALTGLQQGETVDIEYKAGEDFPDKNLIGQSLTFKTTLIELHEPKKLELNEEVAQLLNFKSLEDLKAEDKRKLDKSVEKSVFLYTKRQVLDQLDNMYKFDLPESLVEEEFKIIWDDAKKEIEHEAAEHGDKSPSSKEMEKLEKKYHDLAERRVRLGLVISEIGKEKKITVPKEKMMTAIFEAASHYKGREKEAADFFIKNAEAQARIRAPLLEDEIISLIIKQANTKEKEITLDQFKKEMEKISEE